MAEDQAPAQQTGVVITGTATKEVAAQERRQICFAKAMQGAISSHARVLMHARRTNKLKWPSHR